MDRNEREARRRQEDRALNSALIWVGAAIVLEFLLVLVNRYYIHYRTSEASVDRALAIQAALVGLRWVSLAVLVVCLIWVVIRLSKKSKTTLPGVLSIVAGSLLICSHITLAFKESGVRMLFWLVPAWAALALVFYLYQKEFFLSALLSGLGLLGLWFVRHAGPSSWYTILVAVLVVALAAVALWRKAKGGAVAPAVGKSSGTPAEVNYAPVLISAVVSLVVMALAVFVGGSLAYYLLYAMVAWLFALLVYYTVKMM